VPDGLTAWIAQLLRDPAMTGMGHDQRVADSNLGLGWLYYGFARLWRPRRVVVIGSYRGFAPLLFARALADNGEGGRVTLIEPSLVDAFWTDAAAVAAHFAAHGLSNIDHLCLTTQQCIGHPAWEATGDVGIALIDGYHTAEQARFDQRALEPRLAPGAILMFHDSLRERVSRIYGDERAYMHSVTRHIDSLRDDPAWQVLDLDRGDGLSIVRRVG
jgi:predicted O-methyltransferase YrrM